MVRVKFGHGELVVTSEGVHNPANAV